MSGSEGGGSSGVKDSIRARLHVDSVNAILCEREKGVCRVYLCIKGVGRLAGTFRENNLKCKQNRLMRWMCVIVSPFTGWVNIFKQTSMID